MKIRSATHPLRKFAFLDANGIEVDGGGRWAGMAEPSLREVLRHAMPEGEDAKGIAHAAEASLAVLTAQPVYRATPTYSAEVNFWRLICLGKKSRSR